MMFEFVDSNVILGYNHPYLKATADTYNGYQFASVLNTGVSPSEFRATPYADVASAKAGDVYVMITDITEAEAGDTNSYKKESGEFLKAFRLGDFVDQRVYMTSDLVTTAHASVSAGDTLIPLDATTDASNSMKWVKGVTTGYAYYLEVVEKNNFGESLVKIPVGYECIIREA